MYEYNCTVERVVDGDTIDVVLDLGFSILYKSRVRLYAIDTPESRTRDKDEKVPSGRHQWSAAVERHEADGLVQHEQQDRAGRVLRLIKVLLAALVIQAHRGR